MTSGHQEHAYPPSADRSKPMINPRRALATLVVISLLLAACLGAEATPQLRSLGGAPSWDMVSHTGADLSSEDLRGKVYLVNFIWTSCRDTCPTLSLQMALLQERLKEEGLLGDRVALISISFDHERDTPERLDRYARIFKAEPGGWHILTGSPEEVMRVVTQGFGVSYRLIRSEDADRSNLADQLAPPSEETEAGAALADVIGAEHIGDFLEIDYSIDYDHQSAFVLVDGEGEIRNYYITTFLDRDQVLSDIKGLLK
ncbi:MAG: SCO family protein [Dehalococcoidia bacterium]